MNTNESHVNNAPGLATVGQAVYNRKWSFLVLFVVVLYMTICIASVFDLLPESSKDSASQPIVAAATPLPFIITSTAVELPTKIEIPKIGVSQTVSNPNSTDINVLDEELLSGTVRYPTSSKLGQAGNVIIFGHSSYLPIVNNQAFKALNGIQKLEKGDRIEVTGTDHVYTYAVETVTEESATADSIPLTVSGSKLTLATCDSFGESSDRFVVTATLVETRAL